MIGRMIHAWVRCALRCALCGRPIREGERCLDEEDGEEMILNAETEDYALGGGAMCLPCGNGWGERRGDEEGDLGG